MDSKKNPKAVVTNSSSGENVTNSQREKEKEVFANDSISSSIHHHNRNQGIQNNNLSDKNTKSNPKKMEQLTYMDALVEEAKKKLEASLQTGKNNDNDDLKKTTKSKTKKKAKLKWDIFWRRTMQDMRNKKLIPIKILFFFKAATLFVLYPFLTLHMKSLGLTAAETGVNSACIPVVAILGPPIAGIISDKIGNFKKLLSAITLSTAGFGLLLLLVPNAREIEKLPGNLTFSIGCLPDSADLHHNLPTGTFALEMLGESTCTLNLSNAPWDNLQAASVVQCGLVCPTIPSEVDPSVTPKLSEIPVPETSKTYHLPGKKFLFTPFSDQSVELQCSESTISPSNGSSCYLRFADIVDPDQDQESSDNSTLMSIATTTITTTDIRRLKLNGPGKQGENVTQLRLDIQDSWTFGDEVYKQVPTCVASAVLVQNQSPQVNSSSSVQSNCVQKCLVNYERKLFCSNKEETIVYNVSLTFWLYTLFRVILGLGSATSWIMFEGAVLAILKESGGDYGLQRITALIAGIFVPPLSGSLIYWFNDFRPAFYFYAVLQCVSAFLTLQLDLNFKKPAQNVLSHLMEVLSQIEILIFFCAMFLSGTAWGYLETFFFWFIQSLGGSEILMGLTVSVGAVAGIPLLLLSRMIINKIGHVNVLSIGLLFYCIRLLGYSWIQDPWMTLPFEALEAITTSLCLTAAATYAGALSTVETIASIQGIFGALYFGIGRGAGSLLGGFFLQWYGDRATFQIFAVGAIISSIIYFLLNLVYIRKHTRVHQGLDLTNLRGDKFDYDNELKGQVKRSGIEEIPGATPLAFIGPLDVNAFTDVPLDEEEAIESASEPSKDSKPSKTSKDASRPSSFPQKSKLKLELSHNRPAEI